MGHLRVAIRVELRFAIIISFAQESRRAERDERPVKNVLMCFASTMIEAEELLKAELGGVKAGNVENVFENMIYWTSNESVG